jgi:hypothetical protein
MKVEYEEREIGKVVTAGYMRADFVLGCEKQEMHT